MFEANSRALLRPKAAEQSTMGKEIYRNLSIREILVLTLARLPVQTLGKGRGVRRQPSGERIMTSFLGGNIAVLLGNKRFSWREIA